MLSVRLDVRMDGVADRTRTDTAGLTIPGAGRYTTATKKDGDGRARTGGLSPDKRVLCATELRPLRLKRPVDPMGFLASPYG
jgi:hypothetical protein